MVLRTVVDHLEVEGFPVIDVIQVLHGDDQTQLQDGEAWRQMTQKAVHQSLKKMKDISETYHFLHV